MNDINDYSLLANGGSLTTQGGVTIVRSPLFATGKSALMLLRTNGLSHLPGVHLTVDLKQLVGDDWAPIATLGSGGGSNDRHMTHWVEFERPAKNATRARFSYRFDGPIASEEVELLNV